MDGSKQAGDSAREHRTLLYSHDTFGLGHLRRSRTIATALIEADPDCSALIVTGSPIAGRFDFAERIDHVRLPGVVKLPDGSYSSLNLLMSIDEMVEPVATEIADLVAGAGGILGAATFMVPDLDARLDHLFRLAAERDLDLDFHVDETEDPFASSLAAIAKTALRHGFKGKITCGHCCSLARQPPRVVAETLGLVREAGIAVVSLPMCNLYLQDRVPGRTPRWRGVTLLHELAANGTPVALASDNCRDPFYAYGDHDMLEVFREAVRIGHLDRPLGAWPRAVTATPADIMGLENRGRLAVGAPADLVLFKARTANELLSRPQTDRIVLRNGLPIDQTLPDYSKLDNLVMR